MAGGEFKSDLGVPYTSGGQIVEFGKQKPQIKKEWQANPPPASGGEAALGGNPTREQIAQMLGFGTERDPLIEILVSGEHQDVRAVMRLKAADMEEDLMFADAPPNAYKMGYLLDTIGDRVKALRFIYAVGKKGLPESLEKYADRSKRKEFTDSVTTTINEVAARMTIAEKVHQDMAFADDIGTAAIEAFVRAGKARAYTNNLREVVRSGETEQGFGKFGEKVDRALGMLVDIGEGKAEITLANGKKKLIPNIFAITSNHGLLDWVIDNYIGPALSKEFSKPSGLPGVGEESEEAWKEYAAKDNRSAAICAMMLMKFAKIDTTFGWGITGSGKGEHPTDNPGLLTNLSPAEIAGVALEGGRLLTGSDLEKLNIEIRRASENGLAGRREHPRPAGALSSLGCYPTAFANLFEVMNFEILVPIDEEKISSIRSTSEKDRSKADSTLLKRYDNGVRQVKESVSVWDVWRTGKGKKVSVDGNGHISTKEFDIPQRSLKDIPMDEVVLVNGETDEKYLEFVQGVGADVREIPYGLALMYATKNFFEPVMRTDFIKLYGEITQGDLLLKMNKGIDVFLSVICGAKNIPKETQEKLNNYIRTVFLGSLYVSISRHDDSDENKVRQISSPITDRAGSAVSNDSISDNLMLAATANNFLHDDEAKIAVSSVRYKERELFQRIKSNRKCPLPSQTGWFSKEELKTLEPLYPLGV